MTTHALNQRTATAAAIKRGSAQARAAMQRLDKTSRAELTALYQSTVTEIQQIIFQHADDLGQIPPFGLKPAMDQIEQRLDQLTRESEQLITRHLQTAANLGVDPFIGIDDLAVSTQEAAQAAVQFTRTFTHNDGFNLSGRLWNLNSGANEIASRAVRSAVIQGHSASRAAQEFLTQGQAVPAAVQRQINNANGIKVARVFGEQLMRGEMNPYAQALRIFRTEINRAHGEAYMVTAESHPDHAGFRYMLSPAHPRPDICDMHSSVNLFGLGAGVYPTRERCPWPAHPNILSFVVQVFKDEITAEDRKAKTTRLEWLKAQPVNVQNGVLGARRKAIALQKGILTEREITTPWRVLKKKYQRKGIDIDSLTPPPRPRPVGIEQRGTIDKEAQVFFKTAHEQATEISLRVIDKTTPLDYIAVRNVGISYYAPGKKHIVLSEATIKRKRYNTYFHEYGHHVDFYGFPKGKKPQQLSYLPNENGGVLDSIRAARRSLYARSAAQKQRRVRLQSDMIKFNDGNLADLFGSLTLNQVGWGHSKNYLRHTGNAETEVFAQLFALYARKDRSKWRYVETELPDLAADFVSLLERLDQ